MRHTTPIISKIATSLLLEETLVEIYQVDSFRRSRNGGVEPTEHILRHLLLAKKTPIHKDRLPLSALRLMTRHGIGELDLHSVEMGILADSTIALRLCGDIEIILLNFVEKRSTLLAC